MPRPKFVKPLVLGVACTIPFGLVIGLSINWNHTTFISAVGSSGAKSFVESFGKQYHKSFSRFDVTVESGGTTFAVEELTKGYTNIGNASCNPYPIVNNGFLNKWNNKKTFTLGWEGLVLMYSLPKGLENPDNVKILITENNILDLYGVFSGYHENKDGSKWNPEDKKDTLWYYCDDKESLSEKDTGILQSTKILPFVRAGGNTGANSSIAFSYYSNLADFEEMSEHQKKAFRYGQYGHDGLTIMQTDESNARAYQSFDYKKQPGSMVYLTSSFLTKSNNTKEMKKKGYRFAGYLPNKPEGASAQYIDLDHIDDFIRSISTSGGYNWYRPINLMIDLNLQKAKEFIYWIYFNTRDTTTSVPLSEYYQNSMLNHGANYLTDGEFNSMLSESGETTWEKLFSSDVDDIKLASQRESTDWENIYGAEDLWQ